MQEASASAEPQTNDRRTKIAAEEDEQLLEWYFCEGKTTFARSVTGPMLSRAELYRHGSYPCYKCEDAPGINPETGDWCKRCNGTGFKCFELYENGPITARPTAEIIECRGYEPNESVLTRYGEVSRRMDIVRKKMGELGSNVLEAFYGDSGARWGNTKHGRLFALYPLTKAGRRMLVKSRSAGDPVELSSCEKLGVQAELQTQQPKLWRRELMDQAAVQAELLYLEALSVFCAGEERPKKKKVARRKKSRAENQRNSWADGTPNARDCGFSFDELKEVAGF